MNIAVPYDDSYSEEESRRVLAGLIPRAMEDKWFVFAENSVLHCHRSWTGYCIYQVRLETLGDSVAAGAAQVTSKKSAYRPSRDVTHEARMIEFIIRGLVLGQDIECPLPPELMEEIQKTVESRRDKGRDSSTARIDSWRARLRHFVGRWLGA